MSTQYRKPNAVVLDAAGAHYGNGRTGPLTEGLKLTDLPALLSSAGKLFQGREGVLVIDDGVTLDQLDTSKLAPWKFSELRPWTTYRHPDKVTLVHVAVRAAVEGYKPGPMFEAAKGMAAGRLAELLDRYHEVTGAPWHGTGGIAGCGALRARYNSPEAGRQPRWQYRPPKEVRGLGVMIWQRELPADIPDGWHVHAFDVNAQYLAAMRNAPVAWSGLEHTGGQPFHPDIAGYWLLRRDELPDELVDGRTRPPVISHRIVRNQAVWVTTPTMKYLHREWKLTPEVLDSFTCDNSQEIGRAYAERLMSARLGQLGPVPSPVGNAIKATYAEMVGLCARAGGRVERVDWAHTWQDMARINMHRRTDRAAEQLRAHYAELLADELLAELCAWPIRVDRDTVYYLAPTREHGRIGEALGVGLGAGLFKWEEEKSLTVAQYREKFGSRARI